MPLNDRYHFGYTATYIQDHPFRFCYEIPAEAALAWVKTRFPDVKMGWTTLAKDMTLVADPDLGVRIDGWLNKLFIVVAVEQDKWIALVNWDGRLSVYQERGLATSMEIALNHPAELTANILRSWDRNKIEEFAQHLIGYGAEEKLQTLGDHT